jgi:hypothetical protein
MLGTGSLTITRISATTGTGQLVSPSLFGKWRFVSERQQQETQITKPDPATRNFSSLKLYEKNLQINVTKIGQSLMRHSLFVPKCRFLLGLMLVRYIGPVYWAAALASAYKSHIYITNHGGTAEYPPFSSS